MTIPHAIPMLTFVPASAGDEKQCILVLIGATPEGRKDLVGFNDGGAKVHRIGAKLLLDLKRRGLAVRPELAIADGALGRVRLLSCARAKCRSPEPTSVRILARTRRPP
jgi:hypothetical protein